MAIAISSLQVACGKEADAPALVPRAADVWALVLERLVPRRAEGTDRSTVRCVIQSRSLPRPRTGPYLVEPDDEATRLEEDWVRLHAEWPELRRETWQALASSRNVLDAQQLLGPLEGVVYLPVAQFEELFEEGVERAWQRFHERWGAASDFVVLSPVGFSRAGDQALVYVEFLSGGEAGSGKYCFLTGTPGEWTIQGVFMAWIS